MTSNPRIILLDPRVLLKDSFEEEVIKGLKAEFSRQPWSYNLEKPLGVLIQEARKKGLLDWDLLSKSIRENGLPHFSSNTISSLAADVFKGKPQLLDLDSLKELEKVGKAIIILGNEKGEIEEIINMQIKFALQHKRPGLKEFSEGSFLKQDVDENDTLLINASKNKGRGEAIYRTISRLKDSFDFTVFDREPGVLNRVGDLGKKDGIEDLKKLERVLIGGVEGHPPEGIRAFPSLTAALQRYKSLKEGQNPPHGIPANRIV